MSSRRALTEQEERILFELETIEKLGGSAGYLNSLADADVDAKQSTNDSESGDNLPLTAEHYAAIGSITSLALISTFTLTLPATSSSPSRPTGGTGYIWGPGLGSITLAGDLEIFRPWEEFVSLPNQVKAVGAGKGGAGGAYVRFSVEVEKEGEGNGEKEKEKETVVVARLVGAGIAELVVLGVKGTFKWT